MKVTLANALSFISVETVLDDVLELVQDQRHEYQIATYL
jgi:hypothetical protein